MKLVVNNTVRAIYVHYKEGPVNPSILLKPGLNRVPAKVLKKLLQQSGFRRLLDSGKVSGNQGDIDAAVAAEMEVETNPGALPIPDPQAPGNSRYFPGLNLHKAMPDAGDIPIING